MNTKRRPIQLCSGILTLALGLALSGARPLEAGGRSKAIFGFETMEVDVVENGLDFTFDEAPADENGLPVYGTAFITRGYVYPAGTLTNSMGVNEDGSPEFPEMVIGKWFCRGYFIGEDMNITTGPMVLTTQIMDLGAEPGEQTIVTDGFELVDIDKPGSRAITGGTGLYSTARGQVEQTLLGFTDAMGVKLRMRIKLRTE